jgi:hypothetical protein
LPTLHWLSKENDLKTAKNAPRNDVSAFECNRDRIYEEGLLKRNA